MLKKVSKPSGSANHASYNIITEKGSGSDTGKIGCPTVTVNRISIDKVEQLLIIQYNQDFNERSSEGTFVSREDMRFLQIMEKKPNSS